MAIEAFTNQRKRERERERKREGERVELYAVQRN